MQRIKRIFYILKTIFLPLVLIGFISFKLSFITEFINCPIKFIQINFSELNFKHKKMIISIIIFSILLYLYRKIVTSKKEFAPTDIYGNYHIIIYYIAYFLLGYKKVSLKMKPIPLQFQLLNINKFNIIGEDNYSDKRIKYNILHKGKLNDKLKEINIIIADTYPININNIPDFLKNNYSIIVKREDYNNKGLRINSNELIELLTNEVQKTKEYCRVYNLLLTTPPGVNKNIYEKVFHTIRDKFTLKIYYQNDNYIFIKKHKKIKS